MQRNLLNSLESWNKQPNRKPLILMGARQVGKTWLMETFAKTHYPRHTVIVNFMKSERLRKMFETIDLSPRTVLEVIALETGTRVVPGKTLLVLDEIQESPRALTALKFFSEDMPELAIMAAGSLLGLAVNRDRKPGSEERASFPVGKVEFLDVPPLTFEEFLLAIGENEKQAALARQDWGLVKLFHESYCELLKKYYFVGGMPEAVKAYAETGDFFAVRNVQRSILKSYDEDFAKHADGILLSKIRLLWNSIVAQLAKENKKFVYSAMRSGARARDYEAALAWLQDAGMIKIVRNVSVPKMPLAAYEEFNAFKLYAHDVGLVGAMADLPADILIDGSDIFTHFKGAFTEQFVLEELLARGVSPNYWAPDNLRAEVEFLLQVGREIYPLEAKAADNLRAKSLKSYIDRFNPAKALRVSMAQYSPGAKVCDYPLYAIAEMLSAL